MPPALHLRIALDAKAKGESINNNICRKLEETSTLEKIRTEIELLSEKIDTIYQASSRQSPYPSFVESPADNAIPIALQRTFNPVVSYLQKGNTFFWWSKPDEWSKPNEELDTSLIGIEEPVSEKYK